MRSLPMMALAIAIAVSASPTAARTTSAASAIFSETADNPETAKQGETLPGENRVLARPYSQGVNIIGHSAIDGRKGNLVMAWSGHCAYIADGMRIDGNGSLQTTRPRTVSTPST